MLNRHCSRRCKSWSSSSQRAGEAEVAAEGEVEVAAEVGTESASKEACEPAIVVSRQNSRDGA